MTNRFSRFAQSLLLIVTVAPMPVGQFVAATVAAEPEIRFDRDIRPLLSENCFACHGPDEGNRAADLRLDTFAGATADFGGHAAIVPGASERSAILERITSPDPDLKMPPPETGKSLTDEQVSLLRRWIDGGAVYKGHWAYAPLARPEVPCGADANPASPIDVFVDQELDRNGLTSVGEADRATLVRRLFLDLTGLPPEPADVDAFEADRSNAAWERLVDRVLASPHHAERMAQWWLDLARYADTVGFHGDQPMNVWPYRDWVIKAFHENMPFDAFSRAQLAGDLFPQATQDQRLAAVYNRLALMSAEGGGQEKEYLAKYVADRVRAVGGAWLGSTIGCAECHDHKYDPFTTRDFYSLAAFFTDIKERAIYPFNATDAAKGQMWGEMNRFFSPEESTRLADLDRRLSEARQAFDADPPELAQSREAWVAQMVNPQRFEPLVPLKMDSAGGAILVTAGEHSVISQGPRPDQDHVTLVFDLPPGPLGAIRLEALADKSLPAGGPGRAGDGNFVITEFSASLRPATASDSPQPQAADTPIRLVHATADFEQSVAGHDTPSGKWLAAYTIDGDASGPTVGWAVHEQVGKSHWLVVRPAKPVDVPAGMRLIVSIAQHHGKGYTLGRFRVGVAANSVDNSGPSDLPQAVRQVLEKPAAERKPEETATIAAHHRAIAPEWKERREALAATEKDRAEFLDCVPLVPVTVSGPRRTVRVLPRGNWMDESGAVVEPAPPAFLAPELPAAAEPRSRLYLADWLFSEENPLVARVLANRLWAVCFGEGLSRRLDDHGSQGEPPSHFELVDWLACELRDGSGAAGPWNIRHLLKTIVMSKAYRRSSAASRELIDRDPENRLVARQNRQRIDAEFVRDTMLAVSGLLVPAIGGPSVKPYQPEGYWDYLNFPKRTYVADAGEKLYRRGMYVHWQRQYLHPAMLVFDAPSREECSARRPRSNTPLQALVLLNDPAAVEAARALATKAIREAGPEPEARARFMLRRAVGRMPATAEIDVLARLADGQRAAMAADPEAARRIVTIGASPAPAEIDAVELAAWTAAARAVLNMQETMARN
jgi:hypothetical protein